MQRGFKASCEELAGSLRNELGLSHSAPLPALTLAEHMEIVVVSATDIPGLPSKHMTQLLQHDSSSWSAVTIQLENDTFIIHNAAHAPVRQESDIMHEVAHIVRRHEPSQLVTLDGLDMTLRTYDVAQEEEAAWLGAALQLPRAALLWAIREGMSDAEISQHFTASESQIRYRRGVTGVDIQRRRRRSSAIA